VFLTFIDLITQLKPRVAVIENVRGLLSAPLKHRPHEMRGKNFPSLSQDEQRGGALLFITRKLKQAGYSISFNLYNSANFGAPQQRERVVMTCSRDGKKLPYLTPTHSEQGLYGWPTWKTLREALKGLPEANHHFVKFPEKRLKYYRLLQSGQYWRDLPAELHQEALGEYKRIQEFPEDWIISGTLLDQYRQVGNAVPCSLGQAIARMLLTHLNGETPIVYPDFPYSHYHKTDDISWSLETLGNFEELAVEQLCLKLSLMGQTKLAKDCCELPFKVGASPGFR
jgi:DNA (cytosine-5)-methyltransferase 1